MAYPAAAVRTAPVTAIGLAGLASLQGFVTLILAYGVLIPNTRRRSLLGVAGLTAVPARGDPRGGRGQPGPPAGARPPAGRAVGADPVFPAAIAVFAAARAAALQRRAFEAERRAERIGQYTLKRKLGEGGMGEVWLAEHGLLKRPCAVKFIRPELAANPATAARFAREVQAVTGLSHVNTVRVYDYGRADDGSFYLVMEYLDGPTLEELVRTTGPLPPGRVVYLLRQVCGALAEAHAAGLVHRDLKPGNVIVATLGGQRDVAKLLDFGLVQDLSADADDRLTRTGTVLGTPAYMCPGAGGGGVGRGRPRRRVLPRGGGVLRPDRPAAVRGEEPRPAPRRPPIRAAAVPDRPAARMYRRTSPRSSPAAWRRTRSTATRRPRISTRPWGRAPAPPTGRSRVAAEWWVSGPRRRETRRPARRHPPLGRH